MKRRFGTGLVFLAVIFILSVIFRLWFISLAPQPYMYDQFEYESYALKMWNAPFLLAAHTYRSYPFPLLMVLVYKVAGWGNHQALYTVHAVLDSITAVMVYLLLREFRIREVFAKLGFVLYAFNPFTAGYVGVVLSEVLATFFITATIFSGVRFVRKPSLPVGLLLGFFAGMAAQTRVAAFVWAALPVLLTLVWVRWQRKKLAYLGIATGFVLTVLYPLYTNWQAYRVLSIDKVDNLFAMEVYNGATLKVLPPFTRLYPRATYEMWVEYWSEYHPDYTQATRDALAKKYLDKAIAIIRADPADYIRWRFFKMWYVWQKENFFFYEEPGWTSHRGVIFTGNFILLTLGVLGLLFGRLLSKRTSAMYIWACFLATVLYGTFGFSLTHAEYRLTIPFYPIVIALAALGISALVTAAERPLRVLRRSRV